MFSGYKEIKMENNNRNIWKFLKYLRIKQRTLNKTWVK